MVPVRRADVARVAAPSATPLNLGLNDGTYCPAACVAVMERYGSRTALRNYPTADNRPLKETIARIDQVAPENVFLANGSGPILKQGIPQILKSQILSSLGRTIKHLLTRGGYPVLTTSFTYSKVSDGLEKMRMPVRVLPLRPEDGFQLDLGLLRAALEKQAGLVYLANPNNPTGNVLIRAHELEPLLATFPRSTFWIDEAYVQYVDPDDHAPITPLVQRYPNLVVSRSFSFAYGLASARIGYLLAAPKRIAELERGVTPYRLGGLQEDLALAALTDDEHLPFIRHETAAQRRAIITGLGRLPVELWDSQTNFVLGRRLDGRPAKELADALAARGIQIKTLTPLRGLRFDEYFRVTVGLAEENAFLVSQCVEVLAPAAGPA